MDPTLHQPSDTQEASSHGSPGSRAEPRVRPRRNRHACNGCKRRKIRCNGRNPCGRCQHLSLDCQYSIRGGACEHFEELRAIGDIKASVSALNSEVHSLQKQIKALSVRDSPQGECLPHGPQRTLSQVSSPVPTSSTEPINDSQSCCGPMSTAYSLDIAKSTVQIMGIMVDEDPEAHDASAAAGCVPGGSRQPESRTSQYQPPDPLLEISREEAIRLCNVYDEEMGVLYPLLDIENLIAYVNSLFMVLESEKSSFHHHGPRQLQFLQSDEAQILKTIIAIVLIVEGKGRSQLGERIFGTVQNVVEAKFSKPPSLNSIRLLTLVASYRFHQEDDILAYRTIGVAARMCLELGLHRVDTIGDSLASSDQREANTLFWSVYTTDHRYSFGTGLPFIIHDDDIDPLLPRPDPSFPFLRCMLDFNSISSDVWYSRVITTGIAGAKRNTVGFLDYRLLQWRDKIPAILRYSSDDPLSGQCAHRGLLRMRIMLHLRENQLRIQIYRPVLHSASSIMENPKWAETAVETAMCTIRVLLRLHNTSDLYHRQPVSFNYFLNSAISVLLLAVLHAPLEFSSRIQDDFCMAADLLKSTSTKSYTSQRLYNTVKSLREAVHKLGLIPRGHLSTVPPLESTDSPPWDHTSGTADLAEASSWVWQEPSLTTGQEMGTDLLELFTAANAYAGIGDAEPDPATRVTPIQARDVDGPGSLAAGLGSENEISRILGNFS